MTISNTTEDAILKLIYQAAAWTDYAVNATTTPQTAIANALHTADPGESGTTSTSEATYTSYARVDVTRTSTQWNETTGTVNPVSTISFPAGTGGTGTVTYWSTGHTGTSGSSQAILWSGTVSPNIVTGNGVTPQLTTASTITLD